MIKVRRETFTRINSWVIQVYNFIIVVSCAIIMFCFFTAFLNVWHGDLINGLIGAVIIMIQCFLLMLILKIRDIAVKRS
jgi:hypothetical protein